MRVSFPLFVLLATAVAFAVALPSSLQPDGAKPAPTGTVDLDLPPEQRWAQVVTHIIHRHGYESSFASLVNIINAAMGEAPELIDVLHAVTAERFPTFYAEIIGVVKTLRNLGYGESHGVTLRTFIVLNWMSELQHVNLTSSAFAGAQQAFNRLACTSLIARRADGTVLHARNDDASAHHYTENITVDVTFTRHAGAEVVARSTQFVGWVGVYTAMRPGVASVTEDQRISPKFDKKFYIEYIASQPLAGPTHFIMRQAMIDGGGGPTPANGPADRQSYESILSYLEGVAIGSPAYMVLAGVNSSANNEGAIIARNFTSHRTLRLGNTTEWVPLDWALIQTNYEWWAPLPYPGVDPRRRVLVSAFEAEGQDRAASVDGLLGMLSMQSNGTATTPVNGVLNVATIFSVIMIPANATLQAYLRHGHGCCG